MLALLALALLSNAGNSAYPNVVGRPASLVPLCSDVQPIVGRPCLMLASGGADAGPSPGQGYAFFEWAPLDGGTGGNSGPSNYCTCTAPTTPDGGALTLTRASSAACTKQGTYLPATEIRPGDMALCTANQLPFGAHGGLVEGTADNNCLRSEELCSAPWVDTATCGLNGASAPMTSIAAAVSLRDTSAVAFQGASQVIATTSQTKHAFGCYVQAITVTGATISITGTGNSAGDCSASTSSLSLTGYTRLQCGSTAAYGSGLTAVTVSIDVGTTAATTGFIAVWGCHHEVDAAHGGAGAGAVSSYIPTQGTIATRAAVTRFSFNLVGNPGSIAVSRWGQDNRNQGTTAYMGWQSGLTSGFEFLSFAVDADASLRCYTSALGGTAAPQNGATSGRSWCAVSSSVGLQGQLDNVLLPVDATATPGAGAFIVVGPYNGVTQPWGEFGAMCADPSATRCR